MDTTKPRILLALEYEEYAQEYLRSLPPEHFMESTSQATQRKIVLESLDLVHARRPEVQIFSELLVQYPYNRESRPHQVVPDNMVVLYEKKSKRGAVSTFPCSRSGLSGSSNTSRRPTSARTTTTVSTSTSAN